MVGVVGTRTAHYIHTIPIIPIFHFIFSTASPLLAIISLNPEPQTLRVSFAKGTEASGIESVEFTWYGIKLGWVGPIGDKKGDVRGTS